MNKVLGCIAALPEDEVLNVARPWRLRDSVGLFRWACHSQTLWPSWWWVWQRLQEACHGVTTHRLRSNGILSSATSLEPPQTDTSIRKHTRTSTQTARLREGATIPSYHLRPLKVTNHTILPKSCWDGRSGNGWPWMRGEVRGQGHIQNNWQDRHT